VQNLQQMKAVLNKVLPMFALALWSWTEGVFCLEGTVSRAGKGRMRPVRFLGGVNKSIVENVKGGYTVPTPALHRSQAGHTPSFMWPQTQITSSFSQGRQGKRSAF
jgi:hypothetical protein